MKAKIGIIGGMGPKASQEFYKMIIEHTKAEKDQDHISMIILNDVEMPDRTEAILSGQYDKVYNQLLEDARFLEKGGCEAIAVTCNTSHFFCDMVESQIDIPILHMIKLTAKAVSELYPGAVIGIMATDGTIKTELYQKALEEEGLSYFVPSEPIQKEVMYQIYDRVKSGKRYDSESWKRIEEEYKKAGCKKVILACTELSTINEEEDLSDLYIDAMEVLARNVVSFAGKEWK